jgi:hypothetical protein
VKRRRDDPGPDRERDRLPGPSEPEEPLGSDAAAADAEEPASGFDAWRRRSAAGEVGTAIARGLAAVFAPNENKPVVSAPVPGDPPDPDKGFRVLLDPDDPTKSVAVFFPKAEDPEGPGDPSSN